MIMSFMEGNTMKRKKTGFTLVELLMVLAIITLLVGLLVPSMVVVRRLARETSQRAQLNRIGLSITAFRDEHGEYPQSMQTFTGGLYYCGAHMLAEALLGRDLRGFHPGSRWTMDDDAYDLSNPELVEENLRRRTGPYLERATATVFTAGQLFADTRNLEPDRFMICDAFAVREVTLPNGDRVRAGTPILYYMADPSSRILDRSRPEVSIYSDVHNRFLLQLNRIADGERHPLNNPDFFYSPEGAEGSIVDPRASDLAAGLLWPYRPDSYILISAGVDGLYGTADDITNFGN
jgi:prepilin-type N-terminal cleavage/methylation domain-containing protein